MKATEILSREHRVIVRVLVALEHMVDDALGKGRLDRLEAERALEFFATFADRCHHGKEEDLLFPKLVELGLPSEGGPIAVMLHEHDVGRGAVRGMRETLDGAGAGETDSLAMFRSHAQDFIQLLRDHIAKEDHVLFPLAEGFLKPEGSQALAERFGDVERELGEGLQASMQKRADELAERWNVSDEAVELFEAAAPRGCAH